MYIATMANVLNQLREMVKDIIENEQYKDAINVPFGTPDNNSGVDKTLPRKRRQVKNMAGVLLHLSNAISNVSDPYDICEYATACMRMVHVRDMDIDTWVPLMARVIDLGLGALVVRTADDDPLLCLSVTPVTKPRKHKSKRAEPVVHRQSFRCDMPFQLDGLSSELEVLALAIQMGIPETDRNLMPMPYVGIHADRLGAAIKQFSRGVFLESEGITLSGHLYKIAKEAKEAGGDMVNQLKRCLHNTDEMIKNDSYIDVLPYPSKSKTPAEADKLVSNMRLLMGSELGVVVFPRERFASREAIDTAMYAMYDTVQCIGTKSGVVNATKLGKTTVQGKVLKSAFNAYKHFIRPEQTYSREENEYVCPIARRVGGADPPAEQHRRARTLTVFVL